MNKVAKNANFGHKQGKGFGKWATYPYTTFLELPPRIKVKFAVLLFKRIEELREMDRLI